MPYNKDRRVAPCVHLTGVGHYRVQFERKGAYINVGTFATLEEAQAELAKARAAGEGPARPEFATLGDLLRATFRYDPETGDIVRLRSVNPKRRGRVVTTAKPGPRRYLQVNVKFDGKSQQFLQHRLAFFLTEGRWPEGVVDHINGVPYDNRWCNLRHVTVEENIANAPKPAGRDVLRFGGLYYPAVKGYATPEEAAAARQQLAEILDLL